MASDASASGQLSDLAERLTEKAVVLDDMAEAARRDDEGWLTVARLRGKAEGVRLALSFVEEIIRGA